MEVDITYQSYTCYLMIEYPRTYYIITVPAVDKLKNEKKTHKNGICHQQFQHKCYLHSAVTTL